MTREVSPYLVILVEEDSGPFELIGYEVTGAIPCDTLEEAIRLLREEEEGNDILRWAEELGKYLGDVPYDIKWR